MLLRPKCGVRTTESDLRKLVVDLTYFVVIDKRNEDVSTIGGLVLEDEREWTAE